MTTRYLGLLLFATVFLAGLQPIQHPTHVHIEHALHFVGLTGEEVIVEPGMYRVEGSDDALQLFPETESAALFLQAQTVQHPVPVEEPVALSIPRGQEEHRLVLLLPPQEGVMAVGSTTGLSSRNAQSSPLTEHLLSQSLQAKYQQLGKTPVSNEEQVPTSANPSAQKTPSLVNDRVVLRQYTTSAGQYWTTNERGKKISQFPLLGPSPSAVPQSAAGDRLLWEDQFSGPAQLATLDQNDGSVLTLHTLDSPGSHFRAKSLALASPPALGCYRTGDFQNYYLLWDGSDGTFVVQLIDGTGKALRTTPTQKPLSHLDTIAVWFGFGADGDLWALFRDRKGRSYRYRAMDSKNGYLLDSLRTASMSGFYPMSMTVKPHPKKLFNQAFSGGTAYNDHILWSPVNGHSSRLTAYNSDGSQVVGENRNPVAWPFSHTGFKAMAYTYVPPVCSD